MNYGVRHSIYNCLQWLQWWNGRPVTKSWGEPPMSSYGAENALRGALAEIQEQEDKLREAFERRDYETAAEMAIEWLMYMAPEPTSEANLRNALREVLGEKEEA